MPVRADNHVSPRNLDKNRCAYFIDCVKSTLRNTYSFFWRTFCFLFFFERTEPAAVVERCLASVGIQFMDANLAFMNVSFSF